jgi:hypothetical protein
VARARPEHRPTPKTAVNTGQARARARPGLRAQVRSGLGPGPGLGEPPGSSRAASNQLLQVSEGQG